MTIRKFTLLDKPFQSIFMVFLGAALSFTVYRMNVFIDRVDVVFQHQEKQDGRLDGHDQHFVWIEKSIDDMKQ